MLRNALPDEFDQSCRYGRFHGRTARTGSFLGGGRIRLQVAIYFSLGRERAQKTMPTRWSHLSDQRLGKYAEYYTKMEFTLHGFDVYGAEVDDKSIDFLIRKSHT